MVNNAPAVLDAPVIGRLEPLRPLPVHEVTRAMDEYQRGLQAVLNDNDWQSFFDRDGSERRFVKRPGWRKIATWFGLDLLVDEQRMRVEYDEHGQPVRAIVVGRAVAPNGRAAEDVGACSISERRFSKPDHDIVATATTRALNRATSNLVGMGELSADEVDERDAVELPDWARDIDDDTRASMHAKLATLLGTPERSDAVLNTISARYGLTPMMLARFVDGLHAMLGPELVRLRSAVATTTTTED